MISTELKRLTKLYYSRSEVANMYGISSKSLRKEMKETDGLLQELIKLGYDPKSKRPLKRKMVVLLFQFMGAPCGYECYDLTP